MKKQGCLCWPCWPCSAPSSRESVTRTVLDYDNDNLCSVLTQRTGSVLPKVMLPVILSTLWATLLLAIYAHTAGWYLVEPYAPEWIETTLEYGAAAIREKQDSFFIYIGATLGLLFGFRLSISSTEFHRSITSMTASQSHLADVFSMVVGKVHFEEGDKGQEEAAKQLCVDVMRLATLSFVLAKKGLHESSDLGDHVLSLMSSKQISVIEGAELNQRASLAICMLRQRLYVAMHSGAKPLLTQKDLSIIDLPLAQYNHALTQALRVKQYPMPFPYAQLLTSVLVVYVMVTPICYVHKLGATTPFASFIISALFFSVRQVSIDLHIPFAKKDIHMRIKPYIEKLEETCRCTFRCRFGSEVSAVYHKLKPSSLTE